MRSQGYIPALVAFVVLAAIGGYFVFGRTSAPVVPAREPGVVTSTSTDIVNATSTIVSATSSAPSPTPSSSLKTFTYAEYGISLSYPPTYQLTTAREVTSGTRSYVRPFNQTNGTKVLELNAPNVGGFDVMTAFITLNGSTTPEQKIFGEGKQEIADSYKTFNARILSTDEITVAGKRALRFTVQIPQATLVDVYIPYGGSSVLQFRYSPASRELEQVLSSVRFVD